MFKKINFTDKAVVTIIRVLMFSALLIYVSLIGLAWIVAIFGDTSLVFDLADIEKLHGPLTPWKFALGIGICGFTLASVSMTFWAVHTFFDQFLKHQVFTSTIADAIRNIAIGLIGFWFGTGLWGGFLPFILTYGYEADKAVSLEIPIFESDMVFGIIGVTLLAVAVLLKRGQALQEENQQII